MKPKKCLMIKTKDSRKFFTYRKNMPYLKEFSKTFKAEISEVKADGDSLLDIDDLPSVICNSEYASETKYEVIDDPSKKSRKEILKTADKIKKYVYNRLTSHKPVSLSDLKKRFIKFNLTDSCLSNHLHQAIRGMQKDGHNIEKLSAGEYRMRK